MHPRAIGQYFAPEKNPESQQLLGTPPPPGPPGYYAVYQPPSVHLNVIAQDRPRNVRRRRFWHFFACSLLFVCALDLLVGHQHLFRAFRHVAGAPGRFFGGSGHRSGPHPGAGPWQCADSMNWTAGSRDGPLGFPYFAQTSFTLPVSAAELSFIAEGDNAYGTFEVSHTADAGSDAVVDVEASYRYPRALDDATVCRLHPAEGEWGLGIFTPHWRRPHQERTLRFSVHLRLPASDAPLTVNDLRTDLPLFSHHLGELAETVYFDQIRLKTDNSAIQVDSLAGNFVRARTGNGGIRGTFKTSTELELETDNAPIEVHAELTSGDEGTTKLTLKTSNARIESDISLLSNTSSSTHGAFSVSARTSNGPLTLAFAEAPVDSALTAIARTSNSPARVTLHKTFEGAFDLTTSAFFRSTVEAPDVEDPAGRGRQRKVDVRSIRGSAVRGSAAWEEGGEARGRVSVETSNSPIHLLL